MPELGNKPLLVRRVNLLWYPVALVPILLAGYAGLMGWLPGLVVALALFALIFWVFSLIFAIVAVLRRPREMRQ